MGRGVFITLEGGEGAGKSTQIKKLESFLKGRGLSCLITREPGGSEGAERIRDLLVRGESGRWDGMSEALLNFAARRDHLVKTVWPAIEAGNWVISDRFADSTLAYQGYGYGHDLQKLYDLWDLAIDGYRPDLTYVLDLDVEIGLKRALARRDGEDRFEKMKLDFHHNLRQGFLNIVEKEPGRCKRIDAAQSIDAIHLDMIRILKDRFKGLFS